MNWTLTVKNFGPFKDLSIDLKPLTIFIGRNSTGKSLLLRLLWSISSAEPKDFEKEFENLGGYSKKGTLSLKDKGAVKEYAKLYMRAFSISLLKGIEKKINDVLGISGGIKISSELTTLTVGSSIEPSLDELVEVEVERTSPLSLVFKVKGEEVREDNIYTKDDLDDVLFTRSMHFTYSLFYPLLNPGVTTFLVDGRANLTEFLQSSIRLYDLLDPVSKEYVDSYYKLLNEFNEGKVDISMLRDFLDELGFKVVEKDGFKLPYVEMWNKTNLPLSQAPSGIRESLSIALALGSQGVSVVYIEEPEAHLHPKAQRILAKLIANAVNNGKYVLLTTHSDYLLYSLSNIIALSRKGTGALEPNKVAVYLLRREGEFSKAEKVRVDEEGISEEEFTKVAEEILDERDYIFG
ncbi:AAA family ATPase [Acidianus sp. HS-5]|uniref:AAA family ATPase n=1 Tax=Acidianus sp. HS-5 TaxID=2886040 RepID=UPI001F218397|nr:AAA family ATPase [Acidianus sp. HS-5]